MKQGLVNPVPHPRYEDEVFCRGVLWLNSLSYTDHFNIDDLQPGKTAQRPLDSDVSRPSVADSAVYPGVPGSEAEQTMGIQGRDSERT